MCDRLNARAYFERVCGFVFVRDDCEVQGRSKEACPVNCDAIMSQKDTAEGFVMCTDVSP